jgi:hypothetical protein
MLSHKLLYIYVFYHTCYLNRLSYLAQFDILHNIWHCSAASCIYDFKIDIKSRKECGKICRQVTAVERNAEDFKGSLESRKESASAFVY